MRFSSVIGSAVGKKIKSTLDVIATLAIIAAAGSVLWARFGPPTLVTRAKAPIALPVEPISIQGAPLIGNPSARVVVIEFSDFQCPFCARFSREILPKLKQAYFETGRVALVFRHLPLTAIHPRAEPAAVAAACAQNQGNFWPMHDRLFGEPRQLEDSDLRGYGRAVGLDLAAFDVCQKSPNERVSNDVTTAKTLGLSSTPVFLIGIQDGSSRVKVSQIISGAQAAPEFSKSFDDLLATK